MPRKIKGLTKSAPVKTVAPPALPPPTLVKLEAPYFNAGMVQLQVTGNDVMMIFMRPRPAIDGATQSLTNYGIMEPAAIVAMSPQTAKDISIIFPEVITNFEKEFGEIVTPMMRKRQESKN